MNEIVHIWDCIIIPSQGTEVPVPHWLSSVWMPCGLCPPTRWRCEDPSQHRLGIQVSVLMLACVEGFPGWGKTFLQWDSRTKTGKWLPQYYNAEGFGREGFWSWCEDLIPEGSEWLLVPLLVAVLLSPGTSLLLSSSPCHLVGLSIENLVWCLTHSSLP